MKNSSFRAMTQKNHLILVLKCIEEELGDKERSHSLSKIRCLTLIKDRRRDDDHPGGITSK